MKEKTITKAKTGSSSELTETVFDIINTRLQYIDYQTNQIVASILGNDPKEDSPIEIPDINEFNFAHNNCDSFLTLMEEYSKAKNRLLLLRSKLSDATNQTILDLLTEDRLNRYSEISLNALIDGKLYLKSSR